MGQKTKRNNDLDNSGVKLPTSPKKFSDLTLKSGGTQKNGCVSQAISGYKRDDSL
jgi:hypothetical protein